MRELEREASSHLPRRRLDGMIDQQPSSGAAAGHDPGFGHVREQRDRRDPGHSGARELLRSRGVLFHVDSAQATGKLRSTSALKVDLMSFSAHKPTAPRGRRALHPAQAGVRIEAQIHGGGHERGFRFRHAAHPPIVAWRGVPDRGRGDGRENERVRMLRDRLMRD